MLQSRFLTSLAATAAALLLAASAEAQTAVTLGAPATVDAAQLQPGLGSRYFGGDFKVVDNMPSPEKGLTVGSPGKPILKVDAKSRDGEIFSAGQKQLYGIQMNGFIKFDKPGQWVVGALSNDGVRVRIDGKVVADDPDVHADRYSQPVSVTVAQPGWYPIVLQYFQRKNTAALQLLWQSPSGAQLEVVPPEALAHVPAK
jgi:hypothetical protein